VIVTIVTVLNHVISNVKIGNFFLGEDLLAFLRFPSSTFFTTVHLIMYASLLTLAFVALIAAAPCRHTSRNANQAVDTPSTAAIFPIPNVVKSWTTSPTTSDPLPLNDSTFNPTDLMLSLPPTYVTAPDGIQSLQAHYPQGSYTLEHVPIGGISFYASGPDNVDLTTAKEATLAYSILFPDGFEFNLGGKLPGLCMSTPLHY
jgi:hypothetical protein